MKLLLDTGVAGSAARMLRDLGHDVQWSAEWPIDPGDDQLLAGANREGRVVTTLDKDFGELAILHRMPHCGIVRLSGIAANSQGPSAVHALQRFAIELSAGAIVTVEPGRIRIRPGDA